jgi:hypothetical protein
MRPPFGKLFKLLDSTEEIANIRTLKNEDKAWYVLKPTFIPPQYLLHR